MQIKELKENIDGDKCITFYYYDPKANRKYHSSTFIVTPKTNVIRLKRSFIKELKKQLVDHVIARPKAYNISAFLEASRMREGIEHLIN